MRLIWLAHTPVSSRGQIASSDDEPLVTVAASVTPINPWKLRLLCPYALALDFTPMPHVVHEHLFEVFVHAVDDAVIANVDAIAGL